MSQESSFSFTPQQERDLQETIEKIIGANIFSVHYDPANAELLIYLLRDITMPGHVKKALNQIVGGMAEVDTLAPDTPRYITIKPRHNHSMQQVIDHLMEHARTMPEEGRMR